MSIGNLLNRFQVYFFVLLVTFLSCGEKQNKPVDKNDVKLVSYGEVDLYQSEVHKSTDHMDGDSLSLQSSYIQQWLEDQVFLAEAEKRLSKENHYEINDLVRDYKNSLIGLRYEQALLKDFMDEQISEEEHINYYNDHSEDYRLNESLIKIRIIKVKADSPGLEKFWDDWKKNDPSLIKKYVKDKASLDFDQSKYWKRLSDVKVILPNSIQKKMSFKKNSTHQENVDGYEYFVRIFDRLDEGEIAPYSYVSNQIKKVLLHKKEIRFIKRYKDELLKKAIDGKSVKYYN